jgi:hypothetical protein
VRSVIAARITSDMRAFGGHGQVRLGRQRFLGLGAIATGVVCPCHVLVGLASLVIGGQVLSPAAQDGVHAVYVPIAVLVGALLLGKKTMEVQKSRNSATEVQGE